VAYFEAEVTQIRREKEKFHAQAQHQSTQYIASSRSEDTNRGFRQQSFVGPELSIFPLPHTFSFAARFSVRGTA
jgi:hypothetical protein